MEHIRDTVAAERDAAFERMVQRYWEDERHERRRMALTWLALLGASLAAWATFGLAVYLIVTRLTSAD